MIKLTDEDRVRYTPKKKQTNLEKIRKMPPAQLAEMLYFLIQCLEISCVNCPLGAEHCGNIPNIAEWLESEVEE